MTAMATLVERHSRFVLLVALPDGTAPTSSPTRSRRGSPRCPRNSNNPSPGTKDLRCAAHARFTVNTGVAVYFCDPRSPWQRGSNENTNGLLRQYFPTRSDLALHSQADLEAVAAELNGRPRQTLRWMTPPEALDKALR